MASLAFATTAGAATRVPVQRTVSSESTTFAGYAAGAPTGTAVTSAFAGFKVPTVTCGATESSGVLPMVEIFNSKGASYAAGGVYVVCDNGKLVYGSYIAINGFSPSLSFTAAAGDKITVAVKQTSGGATVTVRDLSHGKSQTYTLLGSSFGGSDDTSNIGDSAVTLNGVNVPNPQFGAISFSRVWTNGVAIGTLPNTVYDEAAAATGGTVEIVSSKLSTAGNWFRTSQMHLA